jgi:hypothetical protein
MENGEIALTLEIIRSPGRRDGHAIFVIELSSVKAGKESG